MIKIQRCCFEVLHIEKELTQRQKTYKLKIQGLVCGFDICRISQQFLSISCHGSCTNHCFDWSSPAIGLALVWLMP